MAPSAICTEATSSDFTDIPLSLPCQEQEKQESVHPTETTAPPSDIPSENQQTSSSTSVSTMTLQSTLMSHGTVDLTELKEEDDRVTAQGAELKATEQTSVLGRDPRDCVSVQFQIPHAPSAPTLYPSLPALEESPVIRLSEEAVKNTEKEPAVLALPEQESSPPSLQHLESVAELSKSKLYPELPKMAPEIQVISLSQGKTSISDYDVLTFFQIRKN